MFVDASVLVAILLREPEADRFKNQILDHPVACTFPIALFEAANALASKKLSSTSEAERRTSELAAQFRLRVVDITPEIGRLALEARGRYGKGTGHPARLNMGDCFAYACAKAHGLSLLYKGDDFVHTDLA